MSSTRSAILPAFAIILFTAVLFRPMSQPDSASGQDGAPAAGDTAAADADAPDAAAGDAGTGDAGTGDADDSSAVGTDANSDTAAEATSDTDSAAAEDKITFPMISLGVGVAIVLGLIIGFKVNAFIALISAAIVVSLMAPGDAAIKISRVADAFGDTAGGIGIVIAMAAVIGKCMLDSGAADRIVRFFVKLLGEKRAPLALMGSGYVLAIPVFFDTVFYLLVPLARSLHRQTKKHYLKYILAIGAGGAITHSLVPPTPGPLLMASTLNVDLGMMILIGALVALPAAFAGVLYASVADALMKTPMRPQPGDEESTSFTEDQLPSLGMSLLPVLLPVLLISVNTLLATIADQEPTAAFSTESFGDAPLLANRISVAGASEESSAERRVYEQLPESTQAILASGSFDEAGMKELVAGFNSLLENKDLYDEDAFLGIKLTNDAKKLLSADGQRMTRATRHHMNRLVLEQSLNDADDETPAIKEHNWMTSKRKAAGIGALIGNPNLALLLSTVIAIWMLAKQRSLGRSEIAEAVETSLMSGGVIILITAGGGAFGAMLKEAQIGGAVQEMFSSFTTTPSGGGMIYLFMAFLVAMVLKIAQGSGTVAMIVGSSMMAAIVSPDAVNYNMVYIATAVGSGSMVGSWMNDSGFWIFAKMGGLTETEALKSWTGMLAFMGIVSLITTLLLANFLPLKVLAG
jgi:GntP family gluconate:H+ symporter